MSDRGLISLVGWLRRGWVRIILGLGFNCFGRLFLWWSIGCTGSL